MSLLRYEPQSPRLRTQYLGQLHYWDCNQYLFWDLHCDLNKILLSRKKKVTWFLNQKYQIRRGIKEFDNSNNKDTRQETLKMVSFMFLSTASQSKVANFWALKSAQDPNWTDFSAHHFHTHFKFGVNLFKPKISGASYT